MKWLDYRERLKIGFNDTKKINYAMTNLLTFVKVDMTKVNFYDFLSFILETGTAVTDGQCLEEFYQYDSYRAKFVWDTLVDHQKSFKDFLSYFVALMNAWKDEERRNDYKRFLAKTLDDALLQYELLSDADGCFIFPKGAGELDGALVSQPLEWLREYPDSYKTYCTALRQYSEGKYIRDIADNLRKALEDFLREFLDNKKDLNSNKKVAEDYLKQANANPLLIKMFVSLLTHYYLLNNEIAKHNNKVDKTYLEFLLYQTGVFIRMLIVVKQESEEASYNAD